MTSQLTNEGVSVFIIEEKTPASDFFVGANRDKHYHPEVSYFMVSFTTKNERNALEWFRHSWIAQDELSELLRQVSADSELHDDFKVLSEDYLSLPRDNFDPELKCYVPDIMTNRVYYFDGRYENSAHFITGNPSLCKSQDEDLETWFNRIDADPRTENTKWKGLVEMKNGKFVRKEVD